MGRQDPDRAARRLRSYTGPEALLSQKPQVYCAAWKLGLEDRLINMCEENSVLTSAPAGSSMELPAGSNLMSPPVSLPLR